MTVHNRDASNMSLTDLQAEYAEVSGKFATAIAEAGPDVDMSLVTVLEGDVAAKSRILVDMNARMDVLHPEIEAKNRMRAAAAAIEAAREPVGQRMTPQGEQKALEIAAEYKSLGVRVTEAKAFGKDSAFAVPFEAKADFTTAAGWAPQNVRSGRVVPYATEAVSFLDLLNVIPWEQSGYPYMEETTYSNGAIEKGEGVAFGEAGLMLTERTETMRKIPVYLPVTDEQLKYVPAARAYIDGRLTTMLRQRLELQCLVGDGSAPNISGYADRATINTQAKAGDPIFDAVYKGMTKVRTVGMAEPDLLVFNPADWQDVRLTRTADGIYIMGNPADAGADRMFGKMVSQTARQTENTVLLGAFAEYSALLAGGALEIKVSDSHGEFFTKGMQAIRAQVYACLAVFRAPAFTLVTGV